MSKTDFFDSVLQVARLIPYGRVSSYGAIARYIGSPRAGRMVGFAMNGSSSQKEFVPAHRVVNRLGILSGKRFFGGTNTMQELLESEGVLVKNDQIQNFEEVFWDPNIELRLD
ncbi:MAG: MGMT family protein [Salinivirgaceae bacterium]|nr:MGMT family protein [Salinivirgaceae bacterium]